MLLKLQMISIITHQPTESPGKRLRAIKTVRLTQQKAGSLRLVKWDVKKDKKNENRVLARPVFAFPATDAFICVCGGKKVCVV